jgi:hypothetical protein
MQSNPVSTKVYYVKKQPKEIRVYSVLISKHDDGRYYGCILHVIPPYGEAKGHFIPGLSSQEVEKAILAWLSDHGTGDNELIGKFMNIILIKSVPAVNFEEISIHMPDWQTRFLKLVQDEKPINYDVYTMPNLSTEIQNELSKRGYRELILDSDNDKHFLIPSKTAI